MLMRGMGAAALPRARRRKRTWAISSLAISTAMRCRQQNSHIIHDGPSRYHGIGGVQAECIPQQAQVLWNF